MRYALCRVAMIAGLLLAFSGPAVAVSPYPSDPDPEAPQPRTFTGKEVRALLPQGGQVDGCTIQVGQIVDSKKGQQSGYFLQFSRTHAANEPDPGKVETYRVVYHYGDDTDNQFTEIRGDADMPYPRVGMVGAYPKDVAREKLDKGPSWAWRATHATILIQQSPDMSGEIIVDLVTGKVVGARFDPGVAAVREGSASHLFCGDMMAPDEHFDPTAMNKVQRAMDFFLKHAAPSLGDKSRNEDDFRFSSRGGPSNRLELDIGGDQKEDEGSATRALGI